MDDKEIEKQIADKLHVLSEEFKSEYFRDKLTPITNVYVDIEAWQDFRLGALLCLISTDVEYEYIRHVLKSEDSVYQNRLHDRTMEFFPAIKDITDEDISNFISDKKNHKVLVRVSPMTTLYSEFNEVLLIIASKNTSLDKDMPPGATIHIGSSSVIYDTEDMVTLAGNIMKSDPRFRVEIYNRPLCKIGRDISTYQMYFIYSIKEFMENPNHKIFFEEGYPIFNASVFGYPLLEVETSGDEEMIKLITSTEFIFNTYTNFSYIPRGVGL